MDGSRDGHTEWSQTYNIVYIIGIIYMQNLFKKIQMNLFTQQKQTHRLREQTYSFKEWRTGGGVTAPEGAPQLESNGHFASFLLCLRCSGFFPTLTCSICIVDPRRRCSISEMRFLTNWLCWASSFSAFAMVHRVAVSSTFSFCSSFVSSLSRIALSFSNSAWTFCLSCRVWFFSNERKRERKKTIFGKAEFAFFFFSYHISK